MASHLHNLNKDFEDAADRQEADDKEKNHGHIVKDDMLRVGVTEDAAAIVTWMQMVECGKP